MPVDLNPILVHMPGWLLVFFRITGIFVLAPVLGSRLIPARIRILWAAGVAFCVYPLLSATHLSVGTDSGNFLAAMSGSHFSLLLLGAAVAMEMAVGALIGYGAVLPIIGMQMAGHMVDQQIGLGLAGIINPELDDESGVIGEFYYILAMMLFLILGGHRLLLGSVLDSFASVPLGSFRITGDVVTLVIGLLAAMFDLAIRVCAPLLCVIFLETVAMGFVARTVPQLNILSVGFPLRILVGVSVLAGAVAAQAGAFTESVAATFRALNGFLAGW